MITCYHKCICFYVTAQKNVHNWAMKILKGWATLNDALVFVCNSGHLHNS